MQKPRTPRELVAHWLEVARRWRMHAATEEESQRYVLEDKADELERLASELSDVLPQDAEPSQDLAAPTPDALVRLWSEAGRQSGNSGATDRANALNECSAALAVSLQQQTGDIAARWRQMIMGAIERTCLKRIEEIEGRVPPAVEITENSRTMVNEEDGSAAFQWKGQTVAIYCPATFVPGIGWRDATVHVSYPAPTVAN